jgi:cobyrinic acid a,c-diamide synthase
MESHLDLGALWELMPSFSPKGGDAAREGESLPRVRLGVARDPAFCFYYPENLGYLSRFGAEVVPFSPLHETRLPAGLDGLYLGGGYPEVFAAQLSENRSMMSGIKELALSGLPVYAECGGLMYLSQGLTGLTGERLPLAGVLPLEVRMLSRLKALGYRQVTLEADCLLGPAGTVARGHEFHYSEITAGGEGLGQAYRLADRRGEGDRREGYCMGNTLASYVHLHFGSNPALARNFVETCRRYNRG